MKCGFTKSHKECGATSCAVETVKKQLKQLKLKKGVDSSREM